MKILVTGGLGFIGSHTIVELIHNNHDIIIIDNLSNSKISVIDKINEITGIKPKYYIGDVGDTNLLEKIFNEHHVDCVIHFAGLKSVNDSIKKPLEYYSHNLGVTFTLINTMTKYNIKKLIFSSSATVYGSQKSPVDESMQTGLNITNPYGKTKHLIEEILKDIQYANPEWSIILLRYFNPLGAHQSGLIGEDPNDIPNNLMPLILKTAVNNTLLNIFGNNYDTIDGTCIRDFVHVMDLASGHVAAIKKLDNPGIHIYNLGTGKGTTVKQVIDMFESVNNIKIPHQYMDRREGDIPVNYANVSKAEKELGWTAVRGLDKMCQDSWKAFRMKI